ncbi:cysteine-rich receptor-like protein kinase 15 [Solanum pennellii]|uniref:Cysteine-rich receptor-like protein kinase 15 n=1 Tax=Solanum pennellii TaxID=28526 RepID=A0ABM1UXN3_SOLPN|nr:cysteine-rich receptor-like protein kinase 15 [Solanum pennellii]
MANGSLDSFVFDQTRRKQLGWSKFFQIIDGIARGLLYLHQDSRLQIMHRDLKASNVLLDAELNLKISDSGLGEPFKEISAETTRKGGYMAPEYALMSSVSAWRMWMEGTPLALVDSSLEDTRSYV